MKCDVDIREDLYEEQWTKLDDLEKHQLQHREVYMFRSNGSDTLPVSQIRGKCDVTLLSSTDRFSDDYLKTEGSHFYTLVYDQNQKTVVTDRGDIRVGPTFQAEIPETLTELQRQNKLDSRKPELLETLVFDGAQLAKEESSVERKKEAADKDSEFTTKASKNEKLEDQAQAEGELTPLEQDLERLITVAKSVGLFSRALDATSSTVQPILQVAACMASRDSTLQWAMDCMHNSGYDLAEAVRKVVTVDGPILVRDQLEAWSPSEAQLFEDGVDRYGKDFNKIRSECLPWKTYASIIEFYYMWKASDRYLSYKRTKQLEQEKKLKKFLLDESHTEIRNSQAVIPDNVANSSRPCEGCCTVTSDTWYSWGPTCRDVVCRLCSDCWAYWKKYGGLKIPQSQRVELMQQQQKKIPGTNDEKKSALRVSTQMNTVEQQRKQKELQNEKEMKKRLKEEGSSDANGGEDSRKGSSEKSEGAPCKKRKLDDEAEEMDDGEEKTTA